MSLRAPSTVTLSGRRFGPLAVAVVAVLAAAHAVGAQPLPFNGPYVGVDVGRQHLIGGALVDGVDTLQDDSRLVGSAVAGLRGQLGRIAIGGELGLGRTDGDLRLEDPARRLDVRYGNRRQWHWALMAGPVLGSRTLLFAYVSEVTRQFAVTVTRDGSVASQSDEQGLLRYGVGLERQVHGPLHARAAIGTSRADFGGRPTNITIGRRLDASVGLLLQF
ncbi:MAG: hypothetical protein R2708_14460 [Vicinamibacterales bacterium]